MARNRFRTLSAEEWLRRHLADGEPHIAGVLIEAASQQEGIKERTLQEARRNIGATTRYIHRAGEYAWYWQLTKVGEQ